MGRRSSNSSEARGIRGGSDETGKGGKVRLSRPSFLFRKKPYDRPISSSGTPRGATSLPARLVDTASNVLVSSASYLFETFFKRRRTLWIGNGAGKGVSPPDLTGSQHVGGLQENTASRSDTRKTSRYVGSAVEGSVEKAEGEDLDLAQVERVLRRQTLSREQVNRLTEVLQASVDRSEGQMQTKVIEKSGKDVNPVQLAKAYMGECTLHIGGIEPSKWSTPGVLSPRLEMKEEVLDGGSTRSYRAYTPAVSSVKMLKRRLIADDDDVSLSREPVRRVRQKLTLNTSPYLRQISAASGLSRTHVKSLVRTGGSPEKVSNSLEKPVPSLKGKFIEEPWQAMGPSVPEESPESSKARETLEVLSTRAEVASAEREPVGVAPSIDLGVSGGKPNVGDVITTDNHVVSEPGKGPLATPEVPTVPTLPPEKTKGFHMSALFEESSSDEEAEIPAKEEACSEVLQPRASATKEDKKQPLDVLSNNVGISTRWTSPSQIQSSVTAGLLNISHGPPAVMLSPPLRSDFVPLTSSSLLTPAAEKLPLKLPGPFPASTHLPSATEKGSQPINASSLLTPAPSVVAWSLAASSVSGSLIAAKDASPCQPEAASTATTAIVAATSPQVLSTSAVVATVSTPAVVASPLAPPATFVVAAETSNVQSSASSSQSATGRVQMVGLVGLAEAASRQESENTILPSSCQTAAVQPEVALAASDSQVGTAVPMATSDSLFKNPTLSAANTFLPVATSPIVQFGKGAEPPATPVSAVPLPDTTTVANSFLKPDNQSSFINESPGVEKMAEVDTMATDFMAEESETPAVPPPAPAFTFGSASNATSTGIGQSSLFGSGPAPAPVPSPFLFPSQSSAASGSSSSIQFSFGPPSSTPAGQLFGFGSSGSSAASSFSADTKSNFPFGASAATSASSVLQATSSASMTFSATAAARSPFAFGAQASQPSPFGAQMVNAASGSAFSFAASPASSGAPSFQFGVSGAGTSMPLSQPFAFGAQSTAAPANPFTQSGAPSSPLPFQFGSSAPAQAQAVFPSGATMPSPTPSPFLFGSQQPAMPAPFTFGGQVGAVPSAQPFGFGGQPSAAASTQNPFASPAPAGQSPFVPAGAAGMEFAGAFSLGAAGGEKTGRKFIKAKRIGGAKRR